VVGTGGSVNDIRTKPSKSKLLIIKYFNYWFFSARIRPL
jgi:hypothetical protein